jgi:hypothetical protein
MHTFTVHPDISVLHDEMNIPGLGFLSINSFVLHAKQPVVIDTGVGLPDRDFVTTLASVLDPSDVRWIWLTHPDRDHTGGLPALLDAAPQARVITTFAGAGILSTERPLPMERVYFLNPGEKLDVGDRTLTGFRPPLFDNPATVGFFDAQSGIAFTSDCFGAPLPESQLASAATIDATPPDDLRACQLLWATVDSPWVSRVDPVKFAASFVPLREFNPSWVLSTHLPPASELAPMIDTLLTAPDAPEFIGPDQAALEAMLRQFEPA